MATILEFRKSEPAPRAEAADCARSPAQIVIFPGVRYERWLEPEPDRTAPAEPADDADERN